ncbi:MAG: hypothetical protein RL641_668 [Candidatus Parcubacteria bacterium]|jgi:hypothetical protein
MNANVKKRLLAGGAVALGLALAGAGITHAASTTPTSNPMSKMVTAISTRFNLNSTDVQAVFDEQRATMEKEHEQVYTDWLNQAVSDGKLTRDQADKIIAKRSELESSRDGLRATFGSKTDTEKHDAMEVEIDTLKKWADDNNIPIEYLMFGGHKVRGDKSFGMMPHGGMHDSMDGPDDDDFDAN